MRDIAETIGRRLKLPVKSIGPEEAQAYFGWLGISPGATCPPRARRHAKKLGWKPTGPGLLADLESLRLAEG